MSELNKRRANVMNFTVRKVETTEGFQGLRDGWNRLLDLSPSRNIFMTWEWMRTWWEFFGQDKRLFILVAERDGAMVGIAPLYVRKVALSRLVTVRQLRFLGTEIVCPDLIDFIVAEGERDARSAFVEYIIEAGRADWDVALLEDVIESSLTVQTILDKSSGQLIPARVEVGRTCPYLPLPDSWPELLVSLSRQFRKNIRNARKKVEAMGRVSFRRISDASSVGYGMGQLIRLHQKRWQRKGLPGAFASSKFADFHKRIADLFNERGWLYLTLLEVNGLAVAARYAFLFDRVSYAYQSGFDPDWAELQVGLAIQSYCIEDEINQRLVEHNFLRGSNALKLRWTWLARNSVAIRFGKSDLRHMMAEADLMLDRRIKPLVKGVLPRWSVDGLRRVR